MNDERTPTVFHGSRQAPGAHGSPILVVDSLRRRFGSREILGGLDLTLDAGERVALCGPNGSGKSTFLRCVAGTLTPSAGRVAIGGYETGTLEARRLVGTSFSQERSFYLRLSGRENLLFFARVHGLGPTEAASQVARLEEELELHTILDQRADRCSAGMIQQLAFARALIGDPPLLVLDEPTRSLDDGAVARLWAAAARRQSTALLIATHNHDDIALCEHRIDLSLPAPERR